MFDAAMKKLTQRNVLKKKNTRLISGSINGKVKDYALTEGLMT